MACVNLGGEARTLFTSGIIARKIGEKARAFVDSASTASELRELTKEIGKPLKPPSELGPSSHSH